MVTTQAQALERQGLRLLATAQRLQELRPEVGGLLDLEIHEIINVGAWLRMLAKMKEEQND